MGAAKSATPPQSRSHAGWPSLCYGGNSFSDNFLWSLSVARRPPGARIVSAAPQRVLQRGDRMNTATDRARPAVQFVAPSVPEVVPHRVRPGRPSAFDFTPAGPVLTANAAPAVFFDASSAATAAVICRLETSPKPHSHLGGWLSRTASIRESGGTYRVRRLTGAVVFTQRSECTARTQRPGMRRACAVSLYTINVSTIALLCVLFANSCGVSRSARVTRWR